MINSQHSDFLQAQINKFPNFFESYLKQSSASLFLKRDEDKLRPSTVLSGERRDQDKNQIMSELKKIFRDFRNQEISLIGLRDLNRNNNLNHTGQHVLETCSQLSDLAELIIQKALKILQEINKTNFDLDILAMGKLGGHELNFSSDIDLIFVLFPSVLPSPPTPLPRVGEGRYSPGVGADLCVRPVINLLQELIDLLDTPTEDGRVYRVDMRLRPFGQSGPLVMTESQLMDYYQNHGRDWERYALIKSRFLIKPQEKNRLACEKFLQDFAYKNKNLEKDYSGADYSMPEIILNIYTAIQKDQKEQKILKNKTHYLNIKLSEGGIREAEFIVQALQLKYAGQDKVLRHRSFIKALMALASQKIITDHQASVLEESYCFLRDLENKLQIKSDQQTHAYPLDLSNLNNLNNFNNFKNLNYSKNNGLRESIAQMMGEPSAKDLDLKIKFHQDRIIQARRNFLENKNQNKETEGAEFLLLTPRERSRTLSEGEGVLVDKIIRRPDDDTSRIYDLNIWARPKISNYFEEISSQDPRCQNLLDQLKKPILEAIDRQEDFNLAKNMMLDVLNNIKNKRSYLSLLISNTRQLDKLLYFLNRSIFLKNLSLQYPGVLPLFWVQDESEPRSKSELKQYLDQHLQGLETLELKLEYLKEQKLLQLCRIAISDLEHKYPIMRISDFLTELAEVILDLACDLTWHEMIDQYGFPAGIKDASDPGFMIVAYGKLGGLELSYSSDLDLVFIYQYPEGFSNGEKKITQEEFYIKLAQKFLNVLQDKTALGSLYPIDNRLRPGGNSGLLVHSINQFSKYQHEEAWTWEHQALLRARPIFSNLDLNAHFDQIRLDVLCLERDPEKLKKDVLSMRERMRENKLKKIKLDLKQTLKQAQGGLVDIEFLVQYLSLLHAHDNPVLVRYTDNIRILEALSDQNFLNKKDADFLIETYRQYRNFLHQETLLGGRLDSLESLNNLNIFEKERGRVWEIFKRFLY